MSLASRLTVGLVQVVLIGAITMALLEALVAVSFRRPGLSLIPPSLLQYLHIQFDRQTIQVMPECAVYDPAVTYTLKPGRCVFANREYSNEYRINSLGVRDDEASLRAPETVILGDSLAMGWGVEQDEAFPSLYERATGSRTLNAGVSSYGTVRALRLFERIDRSQLAHLVIQYTDNDFGENQQFVTANGLRTLTRAEYERTVADHRRTLAYFPGKYAFNMLVQLQALARGRVRAQATAPAGGAGMDDHARVFLQVLEKSPVDLAPLDITVLSIHSEFITAARRAAAASGVEWIRRLRFLDVGRIFGMNGAFYTLDDHPTALGHREIAADLAAALRPGGDR